VNHDPNKVALFRMTIHACTFSSASPNLLLRPVGAYGTSTRTGNMEASVNLCSVLVRLPIVCVGRRASVRDTLVLAGHGQHEIEPACRTTGA